MIYGGIKFFKKHVISDVSVTVDSGENSATNLLDSNKDTFYRSVDSNDSVEEEIVVSFPSGKTIDRLFFIDINWKEFDVKYLLGGSYYDFTNIVTEDGEFSNISETTFSKDTAYYQFDSITCDGVQILARKTQTSNEEKHISRMVYTEEIGEFYGYPVIQGITPRKNSKKIKSESGKYFISKGNETLDIAISFKNYPTGLEAQNDLKLMFSLYDQIDPFFIWPCGGKSGQSNFRHVLKGFDLKDLILVQVLSDTTNRYKDNIYTNPASANFKLVEVTFE